MVAWPYMVADSVGVEVVLVRLVAREHPIARQGGWTATASVEKAQLIRVGARV